MASSSGPVPTIEDWGFYYDLSSRTGMGKRVIELDLKPPSAKRVFLFIF